MAAARHVPNARLRPLCFRRWRPFLAVKSLQPLPVHANAPAFNRYFLDSLLHVSAICPSAAIQRTRLQYIACLAAGLLPIKLVNHHFKALGRGHHIHNAVFFDHASAKICPASNSFDTAFLSFAVLSIRPCGLDTALHLVDQRYDLVLWEPSLLHIQSPTLGTGPALECRCF